MRAVDGVSFDIDRGQILGLVGESGSGKSMTLLSILRLLPNPARISGGTVMFKGRDLASLSAEQMRALRGNEIAMIPADALGALNPVVRVGPQTAEVISDHSPRSTARQAMKRVIDSFGRVHLPNPGFRARSYPHQLSGGMQQRVVIATGLLLEPDLLLADEPTTALDVTVQAQILRLLLEIRETTGATILFVSHDLATVAEISDRILVMYAAKLVEIGPLDQVFASPLHPYTSSLIAASPSISGTVVDELPTIPGAPPDLSSDPGGCRFAPRCWLRDRLGKPARCVEEVPELRPATQGRAAACHFSDRLADRPFRTDPAWDGPHAQDAPNQPQRETK